MTKICRGKRVDNEKWVEGYFVKKIDPLLRTEMCFILVQEYDKSCIDGIPTTLKSEMTWYRVIPETVGQYTGKNIANEKFFKGDIVECVEDYDDGWGYAKSSVVRAVVIWDEENFCWAFEIENKYRQPFNDWTWDNSFVIGNIHDNPELLKAGDDNEK